MHFPWSIKEVWLSLWITFSDYLTPSCLLHVIENIYRDIQHFTSMLWYVSANKEALIDFKSKILAY